MSDSFTFVRVVAGRARHRRGGVRLRTARAWFGRRAGWIAAALAALTGEFTFYEIVILQSSLDTFLTAAALWCSDQCACSIFRLKAEATERRLRAGSQASLAGVLFGLQILNRPNVIVAVAGVIAVAAADPSRCGSPRSSPPASSPRWRRSSLRNAVVAHQFALASLAGRPQLLHRQPRRRRPASTSPSPGVRANIEGQSEDTRRVAEQAAGRSLTRRARSRRISPDSRSTGCAIIRPTAARAVRPASSRWSSTRATSGSTSAIPYYAHDTGSMLVAAVRGPGCSCRSG